MNQRWRGSDRGNFTASSWCGLVLACCLLGACASAGDGSAAGESNGDPLQDFNRGSFALNDFFDWIFFEPLARGWAFVTPEYLRTHLDQVFGNLNFPGYFLNDLLQGELVQARNELGRFLLNTTVGVAGFWDPAGHLGLEGRSEDFGQTLGVWGVADGAYVVLPYVTVPGSTSRDLGAWPIDQVLNVGDSILLPGGLLRGVNRRALLLDEIDEARQTAFDWYVFTRNIHLQQRRALIFNGEVPESEAFEDFYGTDDGLYEFEEGAADLEEGE